MIENPILTAIIMVAIIIFLLLACAFVYMTTPNKFRFFDLPVAYCHRGIHDEKVPENSIPAFKRCAEKEMGVELDVQPTKDGKIVVFHDLDLKRLCGIDKTISELTFDEISELHLKDTEEKIPLLADAIEVLDGVPISCEIKIATAAFDPDFLEGVFQHLKDYKGDYNVISFNPFVLEWFKKNHPEVIRGQLSAANGNIGSGLSVEWVLSNLLLNFKSKPDFISYRWDDKSFGFSLCRFYGTRLCAWTVHSMDEVEKAAYEGFSTFVGEDFDMTEV